MGYLILLATIGVISGLVTKHLDIAGQCFLVAMGLSIMDLIWRFLTGTLELPFVVRTKRMVYFVYQTTDAVDRLSSGQAASNESVAMIVKRLRE